MKSVLVGMSGGVDSSSAATLLQEQGFTVAGARLRMRDDEPPGAADDARTVAGLLGIEFFEEEIVNDFKEKVIDGFVNAYGEGKTPNPCILCNRGVKFPGLKKLARTLGYDYVATGHYARLEGTALKRGLDATKDQSYFLLPSEPHGLQGVLFPLGSMTKVEVRKYAAGKKLPVAGKSESQDVCFIEGDDTARYLSAKLGGPMPGRIVDTGGKALGTHKGSFLYTVGQRRGLGVSAPQPLYVIERDPVENLLIVGPRDMLMSRGMEGFGAVWMDQAPAGGSFACTVKIRSTAADVPCEVQRSGDRVVVHFGEPQFGVAVGQMAVFYDGDTVIGGAWIGKGSR